MPERTLAGRRALISGAASGIGYAVAHALAERGARVVVADLRGGAAQVAADQIAASTGAEVRAIQEDAAVEDHVRHAIAETARLFGGLDILVSNAGRQHVAMIEDFPVDTFRAIVDLMLIGPFLALKYALPLMRAQGHGRILHMASINGLVGFAGKAAYNSAKHGLVGLTKVAALECAADGITVNAICPGYVDTPLVRGQLEDLASTRGVPLERVLEEVIYPLVPQRRLLDPREIAEYAAFLCSDAAAGVTGQAVVIDGGYLAQ